MEPLADYVARERLVHYADRLADAERQLSGFRHQTIELSIAIEARFKEIEIPLNVMKKLLGVCTLGILGILGTMVANAIGMHIR